MHRLYVVELEPAALRDRRIRRQNPQCQAAIALYVGRTALAPEERFKDHMLGYKSCSLVQKYGVRLRPDLAGGGQMAWADAVVAEVELASRLRSAGYAVYQA